MVFGYPYRIPHHCHLFGIAHSTVCGIVHETCQCILDVLMVDYIKFPSSDRLNQTVDEFKTK